MAAAVRFVGVLVQGKKHFGEVHLAGCSGVARGEYPTKECKTPQEAQYECEGAGGYFDNGEFVTDFPTTFAPCVRKEERGE
jgi:hypothetical protein